MRCKRDKLSDPDNGDIFWSVMMSNYKLEADQVRKAARGRWDSILPAVLPFFGEASDRKHCSCPVHGGKNNDAFRFLKDYKETGGGVCNSCGVFKDGFSLLMWATGMSFYEVLKEVHDCLGSPGYLSEIKPREPSPEEVKKREDDDKAQRLRLSAIVRESYPSMAPEAAPLRRYLANRGLMTVPPTLMYHPGLHYVHQGEKLGIWGAMIAVVTSPGNQGVTIHRTYITEDGYKAPVPEPKKLMSHASSVSMRGAAIRLAPCGEVLGASEGIETAIASMEGTGIPVWPTVSAQLMKSFEPPSCVRKLIVFGDRDMTQTGEKAAMELVQRAKERGIQAYLALPPSELVDGQKGVDWHDEYVRRGKSAFEGIS
jgi:hypothetical protein